MDISDPIGALNRLEGGFFGPYLHHNLRTETGTTATYGTATLLQTLRGPVPILAHKSESHRMTGRNARASRPGTTTGTQNP